MSNNRGPRDMLTRFPRSVLQSPSTVLSYFPTSWEEMGNMMTQWMGTNRGVTVSEDDQNIYIEADLPGLRADDINISLHKDTLVIQADKQEEESNKDKRFHRRSQRSFYYEVQLPESVEENTEQARFEEGVLRIAFQKSKQSHMRKIQLSKGSSRSEQQASNGQQKNVQQQKQSKRKGSKKKNQTSSQEKKK